MNQLLVRHALLRFLHVRSATFISWPLDSPTAEEMATAGFFYTGYGTMVVCYSCGVSGSEWTKESPIITHIRMNRTCLHLANVDVTLLTRKPDCYGFYSHSALTYVPPQKYQPTIEENQLLLKDDKLESPPTKLAVGQYPNEFKDLVVPITIYIRLDAPTSNTILDSQGYLILMRKEEERLKTFSAGGWMRTKPTKETLAANGFYHLLMPEYTQCAFCLCVVYLWQEVDVAKYHKETNPLCPFVKGEVVTNTPLDIQPENRITCVVCLTQERSIVFIPCRHLASCKRCADARKFKTCPVCRETITLTQHVFVP